MVELLKASHEVRREVVGNGAPEENSSVMLDVERYISPAFADKEWQAVFSSTWQFACRVDHVANPGDFYVLELGRESVIVSRGADGVIRAFFNVCRHRNNMLVRNKRTGNAASFACSYHMWEWKNTGDLKKIPDRETFPGLPDDCALKLNELKCDTWGGFVFVCMDPKAPPLLEFLHPLPEMLDRYEPERMAIMQDMTVEWDCNWKVGVDAFNETYHVAATHPQLLSVIDDYNVRIECYERHSFFAVPYGVPSPRLADRARIPKLLAQYMDPRGAVLDGTGKAAGSDDELLSAGAVDAASFEGDADDVRQAVQRKKREQQDQFPFLPYRNLSDAELTDDLHVMCFPNTQFNVFAENLLIFRHRPHPDDVNKSFYDVIYLSHVPEGKKPPLPDYAFSKASETDLGLALNQDASNVWSVQRGMQSQSTDGVYLSELEARVRHFHKVLDRHMADAFRSGEK